MPFEDDAKPAPVADSEPPRDAPQPVADEADDEGQAEAPDDDGDNDEAEGSDGAEDRPAKASRSQRYKKTIEQLRSENETLRASQALAKPVEASRTLEERIGYPPAWQDYRGDQIAYAAAQAAYAADRRYVSRQMEGEKRDNDARQEARHESRARLYVEQQALAKTELPDYDKVVKAYTGPQPTQGVADLLIDSEHTARLEYHLAKNPEKLRDLNAMSPLQAAREVGRLEAQLSPSAATRLTQAPAPASSLRGGAAGPRKDLEKMSMSEYVAFRKSQKA